MSQSIITNLDLIQQLAKQRENANWRFRTFVKAHLDTDDDELDAQVKGISDRVSSQIDCTQCANCCKKLQPVVDAADIDRLAGRLGITAVEFQARFVMSEEFGEMCINSTTCPFLEHKLCAVYEDRPKSCRDFPYLHSERIRGRMINMIGNYALCRIVFNTLDELKRETGFLARSRRRKS